LPLNGFFAEAVREKLRRPGAPSEKPWKKAFGGLRDLHEETERMDRLIREESERIDEEERR